MRIHRRQFLKYCIGSAAAMGLPMSVLGKLEQAMAAGGTSLPKVIWLNAANCSGCTVSLANLFSNTGPTDIADLLFNTIDLAFHPTLMAASGDLAVQQLKNTAAGSYILAVDGGIPTAFNGNTCMLWTDGDKEVTALKAVEMLAPNAAAILSIGTCASYGGIAAGNPNPTGIVSVAELAGPDIINIPGCPTHPDWIVWTIAHLLAGEIPKLDENNRPTALYGTKIHKNCPLRDREETKVFGEQDHCLKELGCKGPETTSDCPARKWNNSTNWCIGAGAICIGCTEPRFPDKFSPFYKIEYKYKQFDKPAEEDPNPGNDQGSGSFGFTQVSWDSEKKAITAEGTGIAGQIVTIYNQTISAQLGAVSVNSAGVWKFSQKNPSPVPSRLGAVSGNQTIYADVVSSPDTNTDSNNDQFTVKKAIWRRGKKQFIIRGTGAPETIVDIYNSSTGNKVGKTTVKRKGSWRIVIKKPVTVPCSVLVINQNIELDVAVQKAPKKCV